MTLSAPRKGGVKVERRGRWIWRDRGGVPSPMGRIDDALDINLFVQFRRSFRLDTLPKSAPARISADGRYKLYVNGAYHGRPELGCSRGPFARRASGER